MLRILFSASLLATSVAGYAVAINGAIPVDTESEATSIKRAQALDPSTKHFTKDLPSQAFEGKTYKPIRLEGGMQLDSSCVLEAERMGVNSTQLKAVMEKNMARMLDRILKCGENYPELDKYLKETVYQYRRQIMKCDPPEKQKGLMVPLTNITYDAYNLKTSMVFSNNWLKRALGKTGNQRSHNHALSTVFHEMLHSTSCNNRHDHNEVERMPATVESKDACNQNVSMDRISVVESLCMGEHFNSSGHPAARILANRISMCGTDRGCRDLFTAKGSNITWWEKTFYDASPSSHISDTQAGTLCARIKDDGMCLHFRANQGPVINGADAHLTAVRGNLDARINQVLPGLSNRVPVAFMKLYPDIQKRFDALKDGSCFKRNFYEKNPEDINALRTTASTVPSSTWDMDSALSSHIGRIATDLGSFLAKMNSDECTEETRELRSLLNDYGERLKSSTLVTQLRTLKASNNKGEYLKTKDLRNSSSELVQILGPELVQSYVRTMDKRHSDSPHFDCVATGLAPFRAVSDAARAPACD